MKELIENTILENVFIDNTAMSVDMIKIMKGVRE
tara:strand:- start:487 stop:588 length:102 start_codon:yes stop_codon:yes gene_type:complete